MLTVPLLAQEALLFSQFDKSLYGINPAFSGMESDWTVQAGFRQPYTGFTNGPSTIFAGGTGAITKYRSLFRDQQTMRTSISAETVQQLRQAGNNELKHGLGFFVSRFSSGPFSTYRLNGNYAIHVPLTSKIRGAAGIGVELVNPRLDPGEIRPRDAENDFVYFSLLGIGASRNFLNVDIGLSVYSPTFYAGYTMHSITEVALDPDNSTETQVQYASHSMQAGLNLDVHPLWKVQPSLLVRYDEISEVNATALVRAEWRDQISGGLVYKLDRSAGLVAGFKYRGQYTIGYSYEMIINDDISQLGNGSHEIILSMRLAPFTSSSSPEPR